LIKKDRRADTVRVLKKLRTEDNVDEEIEELLHEADMEKDLPKVAIVRYQ
jgi:hypothetical protein